jgi:CHAD domain-containing protein
MPVDVERIQKSAKKLRKMLKKAPRNPSQEEVHNFRTQTRRFEAALDALAMNSGKNQRVLRGLGKLRKRAGKVRDIDVLSAHALSVHVRGEQSCAVALLEYLGAKRYRQAEKLHAEMKQLRTKLRRQLRRASARLEKVIPEDPKEGNADENEAPADAMAKALRLSDELASPVVLSRNNLHGYRLKVKELRYVLQLAVGRNNKGFVDDLGAVKDSIGEWHDWRELVLVANKVLDHPHCKLLSELRAVANRKYQIGLGLANHMRETYLHTNGSKNKRTPSSIHIPTRKVLEATSAIAS